MTFSYLPAIRGLNQIRPILDLLESFNHEAFICGGYARYCASPNTGQKLVKAGDVDIYCKTQEVFDKIAEHFKSQGLEVRFETDVALTYYKPKDKGNLYRKTPVIQLIKPLDQGQIIASGEIERILSNFDFTVIRTGIVKVDGVYKVLADDNFLHDEEKKFLRILNIHCPISSLLRFMKYARKGYHSRPSQVIKLFFDWDNRPLAYREKLIALFREGEEKGELTQEEIDELEALLRID